MFFIEISLEIYTGWHYFVKLQYASVSKIFESHFCVNMAVKDTFYLQCKSQVLP